MFICTFLVPLCVVGWGAFFITRSRTSRTAKIKKDYPLNKVFLAREMYLSTPFFEKALCFIVCKYELVINSHLAWRYYPQKGYLVVYEVSVKKGGHFLVVKFRYYLRKASGYFTILVISYPHIGSGGLSRCLSRGSSWSVGLSSVDEAKNVRMRSVLFKHLVTTSCYCLRLPFCTLVQGHH